MCDTKRSIGRKCESGLAANVPLRGVFVQDYDSHTQPKLTDRRIQMDAQTRRRERRAEKQAQWKAANPLLVGVSAKPVIEAENINDCYDHRMLWAQIAHADVTNIRIEELKEHQAA